MKLEANAFESLPSCLEYARQHQAYWHTDEGRARQRSYNRKRVTLFAPSVIALILCAFENMRSYAFSTLIITLLVALIINGFIKSGAPIPPRRQMMLNEFLEQLDGDCAAAGWKWFEGMGFYFFCTRKYFGFVRWDDQTYPAYRYFPRESIENICITQVATSADIKTDSDSIHYGDGTYSSTSSQSRATYNFIFTLHVTAGRVTHDFKFSTQHQAEQAKECLI